ncbi:MAG TPA: cellulase family glycosylhydrolase, partial [Nitrososphaera sp.]
VALGSPDVTDIADASPVITNDAPSGGFPVGTTIVTWTATDAAGNSAVAQQSVTLEVGDPDPGESIPWGEYHGVNFVTGVLRQGEFAPSPTRFSIPTADIPEYLDIARDNGFNMLRVVVYQESYEGHKQAFLTELEYVVSEANKRDLDVWIDNHQWRIGGSAYTDSIGMPASYLTGYDIAGKPCSYDNSCKDGETTDPDAVHFWRDLWTNDLRSGIDAWDATADYLKAIVDRIDHYPNVIGYEILNEPQTTRVEDYTNMGEFNTYIAKELRKVTAKDIFYCRDNGVVSPSVNEGWTQGGRNVERAKLIPQGVSGLVYDDHVYSLDRLDNYVADGKVARANRADIRTIAGEWSSPNNKESFLTTFSNAGIASTYWAFGCFGCQINNSLVNDGLKLNPAGLGYRDAIEQVYD